MKTVIVTDIFGKTAALEELANSICKSHIIIDPYNGRDMSFESESDAYEYFISNIGLENYINYLNIALAKLDSTIKLVGFSIGAAAIWNLSGSFDFSHVKKLPVFMGPELETIETLCHVSQLLLFFQNQKNTFRYQIWFRICATL